MILKNLVVGPIAANCYVIGDEDSKSGAIIDPGDEADRILNLVNESELQIEYLIGTHGHFDHIAAVGPLKKALGCDFLLHRNDLPFVANSTATARQWGFDIEQVPDPDRYIDKGDVLKVGKLDLQILHTPGHSPGGICVYLPKENLVFTGDTLFQGSIGRTDFPLGSMETLVRSIQTVLYTLADSTRAYTGHGEPTSIGEEKRNNMFVREQDN
jgi:glyoxylase-like metal-dependent hydrolase (beta-lactamase superfamily II)